MGTKERKERERGQRRREILAAARDLVLKEGPAAVTMDRVAEAAELAKGTLYLYFASRADLVGSLVVEFSGGLADALEAAAATREDPLEALEAVGRAHWEHLRSRAGLAPLQELARTAVFSEGLSPEVGAALREQGLRPFRLMADLVRRAQARGQVSADQDPLELALALAAVSLGVMQLRQGLEGCGLPLEPERLLAGGWTLVLRSVVAGGLPPPAPPAA